MIIRQSATAAALLLAGMLALAGCAPAWLLPPAPMPAPTAAPIATPDAGGDTSGGDTSDGTDTGDEGDGSVDPNELYSWTSMGDNSLWTVSVDIDMNAIAMNISEEGIMMLAGKATLNGSTMVLDLKPDELFTTGDDLNNTFVLTIEDVNASSSSMNVNVNGADKGAVTVKLSNGP